jgi:PAS domain S-box-containing protein
MSSPGNLAEILSKINDGICVFTRDSQISFINEKASQILEANDEAFRQRLTEAMQNRSSDRFEYFHPSLNRWFEHHGYSNADGGLTLISYDITSRHRVEEALRASEDRFKRLIDSNIIGLIVVENGFITEANEIFLNMVNYKHADLVQRRLRWREMTPSEFDAADAKARTELDSKAYLSTYEKEFFRSDGSRVPVLIGGVALPTQGNARETLCLVLDLSGRRRAEERMQSMVEVGKILASSLECERTLPEVAEYIVSKSADLCTIFILEDGRPVRMADARSGAVATAELESDLLRIIQTSEAEITHSPVSRVLLPLTTGDRVSGALAIVAARPDAFDSDDVDFLELFGERIAIAVENARLYRETQRTNRLKDEFVAIVSHELRTPLTPILGAVYMMRHESRDEKVVTRALDLIERNAKTQVKIVDDLLDVSRALSGKLKINVEAVDLARVIQSAVETVRPASEAKGIRLEVRLGAITGIVAGDSDRLQQVVWNLLANAVKFTPRAGCVTVELTEAQGQAEIRVSDTGIGIEPDFLPHVFEKFRQADTSRTRVHGGLGLGLAIVRHLVESHGGTVHALSSGDEQGATFVVRLPLRSKARPAAV